jgi:hypothetical protein
MENKIRNLHIALVGTLFFEIGVFWHPHQSMHTTCYIRPAGTATRKKAGLDASNINHVFRFIHSAYQAKQKFNTFDAAC